MGLMGALLFTQAGSSSRVRILLMQQEGLVGMGNGSVRPPGKSGLTFDHILSRLRGKLQKSCEMGVELNNLTRVMDDLHDTSHW
jgi:hypothetical protein